MSFTPVVIVAVKRVLKGRSIVGTKVPVDPKALTAPETGVSPCCNVKVVAVNVVGSMGTLNVAANILAIETLEAPLAGSVDTTMGRPASAASGPPSVERR